MRVPALLLPDWLMRQPVQQKIQQGGGERLWLLQVGEMRGLQAESFCLGNVAGQYRAVAFPRSGGIFVTADHERGNGDLAKSGASIGVAQSGAAGSIAFGIGSEKYSAGGLRPGALLL